MDSKQLIEKTLDYWRFQLDNGTCTMAELDSVAQQLQSGLDIEGTAEDFARFFGRSEQDVRNVISRKVIAKPRRRVFHKFIPFLKSIPKNWVKDK